MEPKTLEEMTDAELESYIHDCFGDCRVSINSLSTAVWNGQSPARVGYLLSGAERALNDAMTNGQLAVVELKRRRNLPRPA